MHPLVSVSVQITPAGKNITPMGIEISVTVLIIPGCIHIELTDIEIVSTGVCADYTCR